MKYPVVGVTTKDNIKLFGLFAESQKSDCLFIHIHGTASGFYIEEFEKQLVELLTEKNIDVLLTNNRGNFVMESWQKTGAAQEKFEDCVLDIDAWIEFTMSIGYKKIVLSGHSFGTEKVVYYMEKGSYRDKVSSVVLLGFSDSYGDQVRFEKTLDVDLRKEAEELVEQGKGDQFLTSYWLSHAGVLPQNAESYLNFFSEGSELSKALPLRKVKDLFFFQNIQVPILCILGEHDEWAKPYGVDKLLELAADENSNTQTVLIKDTNHGFEGKQEEMARAVRSFILRN